MRLTNDIAAPRGGDEDVRKRKRRGTLLALFRCGNGWRWCGYDRLIVVFATGTADRTAQELRLLVRLRRQAITGRTFAAARRDARFGARLHIDSRLRLRRPLETLGTIRPFGTIWPLWSFCTLWSVYALWPV
jgi:hypothetical protein